MEHEVLRMVLALVVVFGLAAATIILVNVFNNDTM